MPSQRKRIVLIAINDLNYDQRMIRICTSLSQAGYHVTLIGKSNRLSKPLEDKPYYQKRLWVSPSRGMAMYFIYWIKLFFYLLFKRADAFCATDLDTMLPAFYAAKLRNVKIVYDAHEIFTELKEVVTSSQYKRNLWEWIGRTTIPKCDAMYTIGNFYAYFFKEKYGVEMQIIRNATILTDIYIPEKKEKFILYQGAVNEARCFEQLIPAMKWVDAPLIICGNGNFFDRAVALTQKEGLEHKITFKGYVPPQKLKEITIHATAGITLFEDSAVSNIYSMANRFFDYMHNGVPQLCTAYPEYIRVNKQYEIAYLIEEATPEEIAKGLNQLLNDKEYNQRLSENALLAREVYCWQEEEKKLVKIYHNLFNQEKS